MSDHDDMDIDVPPIASANEPKGKRSAANLPVEAEDSLPWYVLQSLKPNNSTARRPLPPADTS